jgi:type I restriction enzyme, S subunit
MKDDAMTNVWPTVLLGEILHLAVDAVPVNDLPEFPIAGVYSFARGLFPREALPNTQTTYKFFHRLHKDMFVISTPKAWEGALARVTDRFDGWFLSPVFPTFRANPERLNIEFLEWFCRQARVWDELRRKSRGIGARRESVSAEQFLSLEIPLPPLSEQRRIVERIQALAGRVAEAQSLRTEASKDVDNLINSFVAHKWFSEKYPKGKFGDVLLEAKNGIYKPPESWGHGIPCVRMYNIAGPGMNTNNMQLLDVTEEEFEVYGCKPGDLVFNRVNSAELVGKTGLITDNYPRCTFESKNIRLRLDPNSMLPKFAATILNSYNIRQYYMSVLKQQCGMATLNHTHLKNIPIPVPPLEEQRRLVAYLDGLQAQVAQLRRYQEQTQKELDALMPSILDKAFKGEL